MVLDPCLALLDEVGIRDLDQCFLIGKRKRVQVKAAHEESTAIDGGDLGV